CDCGQWRKLEMYNRRISLDRKGHQYKSKFLFRCHLNQEWLLIGVPQWIPLKQFFHQKFGNPASTLQRFSLALALVFLICDKVSLDEHLLKFPIVASCPYIAPTRLKARGTAPASCECFVPALLLLFHNELYIRSYTPCHPLLIDMQLYT